MLFYGKVVVLGHKQEITTLLKYFGEEFLIELLNSGRIELIVRQDILGSMIFPGGRYNVEQFSKNEETHQGILYQAHRGIISTSDKNAKFAERMLDLTKPFKYAPEVKDQILIDFENIDLIKRSLPIYLNFRVPNYTLKSDLTVEIVKDNPYGPFDAFSLETNLDLEELNNIHKSNSPESYHPIDFSGFFLALAESRGDIFIASKFESELVTKDLYSKFIEVQFEDLVKRRTKSQVNLDLFDDHVLTDCYSIGDAFMENIISNQDLLNLLEKADKFRSWLGNVPDNRNIINEYYKAVTSETFAENLPTKSVRFVILEGLGILLDLAGAGGIGTVVATGLGALDEFYLDKLLTGWRPNQFIDGVLKPKLSKEN